MTYEEAIDYIQHASVFGVQLGLGRIQELLKRLNNPQEKYKTIHVTGTNGKGSVTAMIASALCEAGFGPGAIRRLIWKNTPNGYTSTAMIFPVLILLQPSPSSGTRWKPWRQMGWNGRRNLK